MDESWVAEFCREPVTIKYPAETIVDGKLAYTEVSGKARVSDFSQKDIDYFGRIECKKIFLIAPLSVNPPVAGQIVHSGNTYEIKAVRVFKDFDDVILAYKCAVA